MKPIIRDGNSKDEKRIRNLLKKEALRLKLYQTGEASKTAAAVYAVRIPVCTKYSGQVNPLYTSLFCIYP